MGRETETVIIVVKRWVYLWCEEGNEEVQVVNTQGVRDDVPTLSKENPQNEDENKSNSKGPSRPDMWCPMVK